MKTSKNPGAKLRRMHVALIDYAKAHGGRIDLDAADLKTLMGGTLYRLSTNISSIRDHYTVNAIRKGRVVVAYEFPDLMALTTPVAPTETPVTSTPDGPEVDVVAEDDAGAPTGPGWTVTR